ncbi:MAG TPA: sulfotransferase family protein [Thiotrichaceae bacterium]|jgi:hypothetical protein|nr:sulfotransferase family protein [Thiotrichaceae bacterium]HIM08014.1 sulfotransferase family protein [Gammaproteobacteria bacterium]
MPLSIIGAGFGRTGTLSLKHALEQLGYAPCYHMHEVSKKPEHIALWQALTNGEKINWDKLFDTYQAAVDWPVASFWQQLAKNYPQAKIILTIRDVDEWYESIHNTIYYVLSQPVSKDNPIKREQGLMTRQLILENTFHGNLGNKEKAIQIYEQHNEKVRQTIPADRLLVYNVTEGWEPLCHFLDCSMPDKAFPNTNSTADFKNNLKTK